MLNSKEHYELMEQFERQFHGRMEKETKSMWPRGNVYQDGHINQAFLGFRSGYAYGKAVERSEQVGPTIKESLTVGDGELVEVAKDAEILRALLTQYVEADEDRLGWTQCMKSQLYREALKTLDSAQVLPTKE